MELLKDKDDFEQWKANNIFGDDVAEDPKDFPCFVYKIVTDWAYQEIAAQYLDSATLRDMLIKINTAANT